MELNERLLAEIAAIFKTVKYGDITFHLSPEKRTLDYDVKTTGKLPLDKLAPQREPLTNKKFFQKTLDRI